jgi:capsule polysaccharide export protein KpsC/LpsZ
LAEIFYIAYIIYSHYVNPETKQPCEIEEAMEYLLSLRKEYFEKYNITNTLAVVQKKIFSYSTSSQFSGKLRSPMISDRVFHL